MNASFPINLNKTVALIGILVFTFSCEMRSNSTELNRLKREIVTKEQQIAELQKKIQELKERKDALDYYRFVPTSDAEINVVEKLSGTEGKIISKKHFKDTLDSSDHFFVYEHTSKITQTSRSDFEAILRDFDQVKSAYGNDFFVRVMTFYNGQRLPLETENSKTDIHILIQPTELGYENKTFVISDFFDVDITALDKEENGVVLTFAHGGFPRKKEHIHISPELVTFKNK